MAAARPAAYELKAMENTTTVGKIIHEVTRAETEGLLVPRLRKIIYEISCADTQGPLDATIYESRRGFSGKKIIGLLQRLAAAFDNNESACYLEVGVFRGLTLLSTAISSPNLSCFGIDNFAFYDPDKENLNYVNAGIEEHRLNNAHIINCDFEKAFANLTAHLQSKKIAVYFIDGPHDYRSQLLCLMLALPYLHPEAVVVVDDCNYRHVRQANRDFLMTHPEWKLVFEAYTPCHPANMSETTSHLAKEGWWNGVNVIVRDRADELAPMFPPTDSGRKLYENDHVIHGARCAELAPRLLDTFQAAARFNVFKAAKLSLRLVFDYMRDRSAFKKRFDRMNTFSDALPVSNFAEFRDIERI